MPYLAARVPPPWEVTHIDEEVEEIDWNLEADVIGLTFHTPSALHAYEIAARFRSSGACVVMGGPHVTLLPEEARQHADVIFIGEAEELWEQFLSGFEAGSYLQTYQRMDAPSLEGFPQSRKDLFHRRDHTSGVLFATRGCPSQCEFCAIAVMYPHKHRTRPIPEVAAEFASFRRKVIIFWDDNIAGDLTYARALFQAITPYRKWWSSQASIHAYGIAVQVGIVFGFDHDTPAIFTETLDFLEEAGVQNGTFNILTPFPGTPLFEKLDRQGRILTRDWSKYNSRTDVVYQPKEMSSTELLAGFQYANQRFYSLTSIARRLSCSPVQLWWTLPLNLAYGYHWWREKGRSAI